MPPPYPALPSSVSASASRPAPASTLTWRDCESGQAECATLRVPRDHDDPDAGMISVALLRLPATGNRRGALVVNPGGPGLPGRSYPLYLAQALPDEVLRSYDLIGFDPRGIGESTALRCQTDREMRGWFRADATPDDRDEIRRLAVLAGRIGEVCAERSPALLEHMGTDDVARDLEVLRRALGDARLSFLGLSYGSLLGAVYAGMYPQRVGRMVLDGVVSPRLDQVSLTQGQIRGFDRALRRMVDDCARSPACPFGRQDSAEILRRINSLLERLDRRPLDSGSGLPLTQTEAVSGIIAGLYSPVSWDSTMLALARAVEGDGRDLASAGRGFLTGDATFLSAFYAVSCSDSPATPGTRELSDWAAREARRVAVPELARYLAWSVLPCTTWPTHRPKPFGRIDAAGAPPVLLVGTTYDPATPLSWARSLAEDLDSARLLEYRADGHVAISAGSSCISAVVGGYLTAGRLPREGAICR